MSGGSVLGYTGFFLDMVTGGYPLGNGYRMYLPGLMRFSAPDESSPFAEGGINSYAYCADDPINYSDPTGHALEGLEEILADATRGSLPHVSVEDVEALDASETVSLSGAGSSHATTGGAAGPSASDTSLAAAHAGGVEVPEALKRWLDPYMPPRPVELTANQLEGAELMDREQIFNDAYINGQIKLYPEVFHPQEGVLVEWEPLIKVNDGIVDRNDPRVVKLMMDFHATKGRGTKTASSNKYRIRKGTSKLLPKGLTLARALEAAIGSRNNPGGFTPILIHGYEKNRAAYQYTRFLAQRLKYLDG